MEMELPESRSANKCLSPIDTVAVDHSGISIISLGRIEATTGSFDEVALAGLAFWYRSFISNAFSDEVSEAYLSSGRRVDCNKV